jgi:FkbM family methyltransferase
MITHNFNGIDFYFNETPQAQELINEIFSDNYNVLKSNIQFEPGDIILDLGACEGMFSIMMAKLFPQVTIISLEPVPRTFFMMVRNIGLNGVMNISSHNYGVGKCRSDIPIYVGKNDYSGGSSSKLTFNPENHIEMRVKVFGLDEIFEIFKIRKCKLLKIDIEGSEYDALYNSTVLDRVEFFTGELHINSKLSYAGYRIDGLANWVSNRTKILQIEVCNMAE